MELSIPYELEAPDGSRIVFGNCEDAQTDTDYVGWIDPDAGIAGLDSPEVREHSQDLIGASGAIHYDFFHGRRPVVANVVLDPRVMDVLGVDALERKVLDATNAMTDDAFLRWTSTILATERRLALRRQAPPRITGRRPKNAQLTLVSSDYRILSEAEHASVAQAAGNNRNVTNAGNETATPVVELTAAGGGASGAIEVENVTAGLKVKFKAGTAVPAGQVLAVSFEPPFPIVTINGVDAYGQVDFLPSTWWGLVPGVNAVKVTTPVGGGNFVVRHRDAWLH